MTKLNKSRIVGSSLEGSMIEGFKVKINAIKDGIAVYIDSL